LTISDGAPHVGGVADVGSGSPSGDLHGGQARTTEVPGMSRYWQYTVLEFDFSREVREQTLAMLNERGARGWEIIALMPASGGVQTNWFKGKVLLKRETA
jgi:hypothetical protein